MERIPPNSEKPKEKKKKRRRRKTKYREEEKKELPLPNLRMKQILTVPVRTAYPPSRYAKGKNMKSTFYFSVVLILVSFTHISYSENPDDIYFTSYVEDLVRLLNSGQHDTLENNLDKIEEETSNQIVVAIINNLGGIKIEDFAFEVANRSKVGQKIKDNGVLILMTLQERQIRVEVGYGLESVITDDLASNIIEDSFKPQFKVGNYYEGLYNGIKAIESYLYKEDVHYYFSMKWDISNFEAFIEKYPNSVLKCDALMFLGRFYEDLWNDRLKKVLGKKDREKSISYYQRYLKECPNGIRRIIVEHELFLVSSKKQDSKRYLISK